MKLHRLVLSLVALPAAVFAANAGNSIPGGNQSSTFVISKPGAYYLAGSRVMTDNTKNAIEITAPDVTLDLAGYSVSFANAGGGVGVGINVPTAVNVEIRNGSVINIPGAAIRSEITTGDGFRLIDLRVSDSRGIYSAAADTLIDRCHVLDTSLFAAIRATGVGAVVRHCHIRNASNNSGITVGAGSQVIGNVVSEVGANGIDFQILNGGESGGLIVDNMVRKANTVGAEWSAGIRVSSSGAVVRGNNVHDCRGAGIRADGYGHVIDANTASYSKAGNYTGVGHGIVSINASTLVRNNTGVGNAGDLLNGNYTDAGGNNGN